ncbi:hypothetical protein FB451DRAFT_1412336 [Mycena latifolia]|nr:hypothetical protein FB451DRAFT_1412336 [Mycena latifolia]
MSSKNTPILAATIPAFELFISSWESMLADFDLEEENIVEIITPGLDIARKYYNKFDNTDAYITAMSPTLSRPGSGQSDVWFQQSNRFSGLPPLIPVSWSGFSPGVPDSYSSGSTGNGFAGSTQVPQCSTSIGLFCWNTDRAR